MRIECPRCKHLQEVADHLAGQVVSCVSCREQFRMPAASAGPPPLSATASRESDGGAVASLVLAILGLTCLGPLSQIPAVIIGHRSLGRIRRSNGTLGGGGMALAGVIIGYAGMVMMLFTILVLGSIMLPALGRAQEAARRASCQNNLKIHGLVCKMYAGENRGGYFPRMSPEPGRLMYALGDGEGRDDGYSVYPMYLNDLSVLYCPSGAEAPSGDPAVDLDDHSYFYINYVIDSDESAEALADAYVTAMAAGEELPDTVPVAMGQGAAGRDTIPSTREGVERLLIRDTGNPGAGAMAQSTIPVMIERLGNHTTVGGSVLFMDGHVEFIRYPGKFPMTERTVAALEKMDQARGPESR